MQYYQYSIQPEVSSPQCFRMPRLCSISLTQEQRQDNSTSVYTGLSIHIAFRWPGPISFILRQEGQFCGRLELPGPSLAQYSMKGGPWLAQYSMKGSLWSNPQADWTWNGTNSSTLWPSQVASLHSRHWIALMYFLHLHFFVNRVGNVKTAQCSQSFRYSKCLI